MSSLLNSWLLALRAEEVAPRTLRNYRHTLTKFDNWLSPRSLPDATRDDVRAWLVELRDEGELARSTIRHHLVVLRTCYRWAIREGRMTRDPTAGIKTPPAGEHVTPTLTIDQCAALVDGCRGHLRDRAILLVMLDTGIRSEECLGLTVASVDFDTLSLHVTGKGAGRSGKRSRTVPIGIRTAQAIDHYLADRERHGIVADVLWLVGEKRPLGYSGLYGMVARRGAAIGVRIRPHVLRHTWASQFRSGPDRGSEGELMVLGGWRSRTMLDRYGAVDAVSRALETGRRLSLGDRLGR